MSRQAVQFNVSLAISDGGFDAFEGIVRNMIAATIEEPGALGYEFYLSSDRKHCHLIEDYKDAEAVEAHMQGAAVKEFVPKLLEISSLRSFHVYGDPGAKAARGLAEMGAEIFSFWLGLGR